MLKKICLVTILALTIITDSAFSKTPEQNELIQIIEQPQALTDKENLLIERINSASLIGNAPLMLDYYRSLIQSFMSEDKQFNIINFSLGFLSKILVYQNFLFAKELLNHLDYRVEYLSRASETTKNNWKTSIEWYKTVVHLLEQDSPENTLIPESLVLKISEDKKPSIDILLQELVLGLTEKSYSEVKFQHLYLALDTANTLHNIEMYYLISTILIKVYLKTKEYTSAVTRLNFLYQLFSNIQPSDYYRIKILIYFTQVFLINGNEKEAYTSYIRAKEMLLYNRVISTQEATRLQELIQQMAPEATSFIKNKKLGSDFFNQFLANIQ